MSSFLEARLPESLSLGAAGGPEFSTSVTELQSGHEQRNINWSTARAHYSIQHGPETPEDFEALLAFFRAVNGRATGFRFKDWTDYQAAGEVLGTGNGSATTFQLKKHYTAGSTTVSRTITKPVSGTVSIYKDSVLQTSGVSVSTTTGLVTFVSPPAGDVVVSADFEFDVPVRFDTDRLSASIESFGSREWKDIKLVEVRI